MRKAIAAFVITVGVLIFAVLWLVDGPRVPFDNFFLIPLVAFLLTLFMPTTRALLGCISFFVGLWFLLLVLTDFRDPVGIGLAFLTFVFSGAAGGAAVNVLMRFVWRRWQSAQQSVQPDRREDAAPG